jgi:ABC-type polysaccharide/polyol phosphate transport system ATPase subunit
MTVVFEDVWVGARRQRGISHRTEQRWALQSVSLRIKTGERVAILGNNGSGKTTLLRTISRVYLPERGRAHVSGTVASVIDLTPGVERDLTGNDVLPVRAALLGVSQADLERRRSKIMELSGIDALTMAMPLARWSAGTLLRLEFSLAVSLDPSVLAIDEVLASADWDFRRRALATMTELSQGETAIVFATHDYVLVEELADRAVVLEGGRVVMDAAAALVVERLRTGGQDSVRQVTGESRASVGRRS